MLSRFHTLLLSVSLSAESNERFGIVIVDLGRERQAESMVDDWTEKYGFIYA